MPTSLSCVSLPRSQMQGSRKLRGGIRLLALIGALASIPAHASELSAEQAVDVAIQRNPRLSAAARLIGAAEFGARSAGSLAGADLMFTPGVTSLSGTGEELLLQQPLELNGTRSARVGVARAQVDVARAEAVVELRRLVFETKSAYHELHRAREQQAVSAELLRFAEELDRIARRQVELGVRPGIDRTQTGLQISQARQQLDLDSGRAAAALATLNTLLGRSPDTPASVLPPPVAPTPALDRAQLLAEALRNRAEISLEAAGRDAFRQEARLVRAEGRPDLTPQLRAGSVVRGFRDSGVGIGITLPLFDHGRRRNRIRQAEEGVRAQEDRISAARNEVSREVDQSIAQLTAVDAVVLTYKQEVLDAARRLLDSTATGFRTGLTPVTAVLDAQRTYRTVQQGYVNALVDRALALAELERATGGVSARLLPLPKNGAH